MGKKRLVAFVVSGALATCFPLYSQSSSPSYKYAATIKEEDLSSLLKVYASDDFEGREAGTKGERKALDFLKSYYKRLGVTPGIAGKFYLQNTTNKKHTNSNVIAVVKGSKKPDEYVFISAHLDHIGISADKQINNGADDDGSGTVAILEIAEAFQKAKEDGLGPERSVVFFHATGEEKGLLGSEYYTENPVFPLSSTVVDLNIDMIGRTDPQRQGADEYIYLIGSDKLSTDLHRLSEKVNESCCKLDLDYKFNSEEDPNRFYYRSDHYNFAKNNIPVIFYFNGVHEDYHKPTDTSDKIRYDLLAKRAKLVFYTAWEIANRSERIALDK